MKKWTGMLAFATVVLSGVASAGPMPKIKKIEGHLAESFEGLKTFSLTNSDLDACTQTYNDPIFKIWECKDKDGPLASLNNTVPSKLSLSFAKSYKVFYKNYDKKWYWEFHLNGVTGNEFQNSGIPDQSETSVVWWLDEAKPEVIKVIWEIPDLGISRSFYATPNNG